MDNDYGMVIYNTNTRKYYNGMNLWVKPLKKARIFNDFDSVKSIIDNELESGNVIDKAFIVVYEVAIVVTNIKKLPVV